MDKGAADVILYGSNIKDTSYNQHLKQQGTIILPVFYLHHQPNQPNLHLEPKAALVMSRGVVLVYLPIGDYSYKS